jgi:hypothetical protein
MGKNTTNDNHSNNHLDYTDLTIIRGIGIAKQKWLNKLGIHTIQELSQTSIASLNKQLKQQGYSAAHSELEDWIKQAQKLSPVSKKSDLKQKHLNIKPSVNQGSEAQIIETPESLSREPFEEFSEELSEELPKNRSQTDSKTAIADKERLESKSKKTPEVASIIDGMTQDWQSVASFTVEFQTRQMEGHKKHRAIIHHQETDTTKTFLNFKNEQLQEWLLHQAKVASLLTAISPDSISRDAPFAIDIVRLRVLQAGQTNVPMVANQTDPMFSGSLATQIPFILELTVAVPEAAISALASQLLIYFATAQARHLATGEIFSLGSVEMRFLLGNKNTCTLMLPKVTLTKAGAYRLQVCAEIKNIPVNPGYFKVPLLQLESMEPSMGCALVLG